MKRQGTLIVAGVLATLVLASIYSIEMTPAPTSLPTQVVSSTTTSTEMTSPSRDPGLGQDAEVTAVDQNGTELIVPVLVNGTIGGYTPQFVSLSGNSTASVTCQPLEGFASVATGPFNATAGQLVTCAYNLATSVSTNGMVTLIINTYETGYGPYSYGQIQISDLQGNVLQTGMTGASGYGNFTVPAKTSMEVVWLGVGGMVDPAAGQELTTGTVTPEVLTLSGNPAQGNSPCMMMNPNAC